jgi:hypothetical protein
MSRDDMYCTPACRAFDAKEFHLFGRLGNRTLMATVLSCLSGKPA